MKYSIIKYFVFLIALFLGLQSLAQQITHSATSPNNAVQNELLGSGVNVSNITYNGSTTGVNNNQNPVRVFDANGSGFPIAQGIILTTANASNTGTFGDPGLEQLAGEILFESHDVNIGWNGTYGGNIVQEGTYIWKIRYKETWADKHSIRTGHVTLFR